MTFRFWGRRQPAVDTYIPDVLDANWLIARIINRDHEIDQLCEMRARSVELVALLLGVTEQETEQHIIAIKRALDAVEMEEQVLSDIAALPEEPAQ